MALVLSRRIGESVMLGTGLEEMGITVRVVSVYGNQVKLAFEAPEEIVILREEVWQREVGDGDIQETG